MCKTYPTCNGCPAKPGSGVCPINCNGRGYTAEQKVATVEQWAQEHPRKTRQSEFLRQWPDAIIGSDGVLSICPAELVQNKRLENGRCRRLMDDCIDCRREFWLKEVE